MQPEDRALRVYMALANLRERLPSRSDGDQRNTELTEDIMDDVWAMLTQAQRDVVNKWNGHGK